MPFDIHFIIRLIPALLDGAVITVELAILTFMICLVWGLLVALAQSTHGPLGWIAGSYVQAVRNTPLLIQHSERDIRTTVGQAEALFTVLRSKKRPVRLMRVPEETHELTRSGTPFRRAENLVQVRDWFRHFLVEGKRALPPLPKVRAGR